ncbi:MAG TPA: hypothetical protein VF802_04360 [Candidatus Limnocylindrales bacterium]
MTNPAEPRPSMPFGIRFFLVYAFLILAGIGLSLRWVIDQAIDAPVSFVGILWMGLLAYTIFTITLVLQRKEAARNLALGLSSLTIPAVPALLLGGSIAGIVAAIAMAVVATALFRGLTRPVARQYLSEQ